MRDTPRDTIDGGVLDSDDSSLNVGDGLHPNAAGVDFIVERVVPQTIALGAAAGVVNEPLLLANGAFEMWFTLDDLSQPQTLFAKDSAAAAPAARSPRSSAPTAGSPSR